MKKLSVALANIIVLYGVSLLSPASFRSHLSRSQLNPVPRFHPLNRTKDGRRTAPLQLIQVRYRPQCQQKTETATRLP
jgi:hypothetical protein